MVHDYIGHETPPAVPRKRRPGLRLITSLLLAVLLFVGGIAVGRQTDKQAKTTAAIDYSSVNKLYSVLQKDFDGQLDSSKLIDGIKHGLIQATGDPYTLYLNSKEAKDFNDQLAGSFSGIGAELGSVNGKIVIVSPLAGYPAAKAGLKPKDVVAAVNGKPTIGLSIDAVVSKIRGTPGSSVHLTIIRNDGNPFEVKIIRQTIKIPSVKSEIDGKIGILHISQFNEDTVGLAQKAAKQFVDKKVKGVILDLRGDPGGFLDGAVNVSSLWLDAGQKVVDERRGQTVTDSLSAKGDNILKGLPTVVLIDGGSASASEITAGALHDNGAAQLVGDKSFGKGSVQRVECLEVTNLDGSCQGAELKVTVARWYTPKGVNIDKTGIKPDFKVKVSDADIKAGRDPQKAKALDLLQQKIH